MELHEVRLAKNDVESFGIPTDTATDVLELARSSGAVLVRGMDVPETPDLSSIVASFGGSGAVFVEESSPRTQLLPGVFTATDYSNKYPIQFHNEFSYASSWPEFLAFFCVQPASSGGQTLLADCRGVMERLSYGLIDELFEREIMYERNYFDASVVGWSEAYGTDSREQVESIARERQIEVEWCEKNGLTTRQIGRAIERHVPTGERVWFNHALFFNVAGLEPPWLRTIYERELPRHRASNTYFGDGEPFPASMLAEVADAYRAEQLMVEWQRGDLLVIDNMLTAHGRAPFVGNRSLAVTMIGRRQREPRAS